MRFIFKVGVVFIVSLLLIFVLAACGDKDKNEDGGDASKGNSSVVIGNTDDGSSINVDDIFGNDGSSSESSSGSSSGSSSSNVSDGNDSASSEVSSDDSSSDDSGNNSSGINYDDPSIWTDPV